MLRRAIALASLVAGLLLQGPAAGEAQTLAGRYTGVFPCADCPGIAYRLDLFDDGAYFLRATYLGRAAGERDRIGRWVLATDGRTLVLADRRETVLYLEAIAPGVLEKLDSAGLPIVAAHHHQLRRDPALAPIEPRTAMRGTFHYLADAALFVDCASGLRLPVALEGAYVELERAYLRLQRAPGEPLMAELAGRIAARPAIEGGAMVPTLVVERFDRFRPGVACAPAPANAPLAGTRWKLVGLAGQPVEAEGLVHVPHLVLDQERGTVSGATGCNRLTGRHLSDGAAIRFEAIATTRMACARGMATESGLLAALRDARRWRIAGDLLDLFDADGRPAGRFAAER